MKQNNYLEYYKGKSSLLDRIAFICNTVLIIIFTYDSIFGDIRMLFILLPIVIVEIYLLIYCIIPENYYFFEDYLKIYHFLKKDLLIKYEDVFNMDAEIKDNFININKSNEIKIYYLKNNHKKCVVCRTDESLKFVSSIKKYCSVFKECINKDAEINKLF